MLARSRAASRRADAIARLDSSAHPRAARAIGASFFIVVGQLARRRSSTSATSCSTFFLAWLLAFIISPIVAAIVGSIPRLPRVVATVIVYTLRRRRPGRRRRPRRAGARHVDHAIHRQRCPDIQRDLPTILAPWQAWLDRSASARSTSQRRRELPRQPRRLSPARSSGRSSRSPWRASASLGTC